MDTRAWAAIWKAAAKANRRTAQRYADLVAYRWNLVVSYIDLLAKKIKWARGWKLAAKLNRRLARQYIKMYLAADNDKWDWIERYCQARDWASIWKTMAKAYRAISLSQQDILDRYTQWIDPTVELPKEGQLIAWLREGGRVAVAYHAYPDRVWQRQVIGWHPLPPLPDLSTVDKPKSKT